MAATNAIIAEVLRRQATVLTLEGANRFKARAYRRGAKTIEFLDADVADLVAQGDDLTWLPGVGPTISRRICEIVRSRWFRSSGKGESPDRGSSGCSVTRKPRCRPERN